MHATAGLVPVFRHEQRAMLQVLSKTRYSQGISLDWLIHVSTHGSDSVVETVFDAELGR